LFAGKKREIEGAERGAIMAKKKPIKRVVEKPSPKKHTPSRGFLVFLV
jgi:hypothetical protein